MNKKKKMEYNNKRNNSKCKNNKDYLKINKMRSN